MYLSVDQLLVLTNVEHNLKKRLEAGQKFLNDDPIVLEQELL
jgi:hypothetical protein